MSKKTRFVILHDTLEQSLHEEDLTQGHLPMHRHILNVALLASLALACACERAADLENPKHYDRDLIAFDYPGNWTVTSDEVDADGFRTIVIETPGDGLVLIQHFKEVPALDLDAYAKLFADLTKKEMPFGQVSDGVFSPYPYTPPGSALVLHGLQQRFHITVMEQEVPHVRGFFGFDEHYPRTAFICQVASEDLKDVRPGCDLVLNHLEVN